MKQLSFIIVYCLILVLLAEVTVRIYLAFNMMYDVEMTRYSNLIKMESDDPEIGHEHTPNSKAHLMGVDVSINNDGLRDKDYPVAKTDAYRIAVLGDSLTFGWGAKEEETFSTRLENQINETQAVEMLNFGTGNYNTSQQVSLFEKKGIKYQADMVLVFYFINDAEETPVKSKLWWLGYSRLVTFYWSRVHNLISNQSEKGSFEQYYSSLYKEGEPGWEKTKASFLRLQKRCKDLGIPLQVFILPELHNLKDYPFEREHNMLIEFLKSNEIAVQDLLASFKSYKDDPIKLWVSYDDAHPNGIAHGMIAEYARPTILKRMNDND